ncbi:hypothetical protein SLEP1_g52390 [Rubroshorea leprosula]|uniref:Uncharacterized protein n=1 Tax=Rubroshorea leprosula TaxID=152421 RepID=A0AAV5M6W5_9ROSI|nr:hypothetical protein SLEP1_g52390 [Rubroshorea leprosula]
MGQIFLFFATGSRVLRKEDRISLRLVMFWKGLLKFITAWVDSSDFRIGVKVWKPTSSSCWTGWQCLKDLKSMQVLGSRSWFGGAGSVLPINDNEDSRIGSVLAGGDMELADGLTKALPTAPFSSLPSKIGVADGTSILRGRVKATVYQASSA